MALSFGRGGGYSLRGVVPRVARVVVKRRGGAACGRTAGGWKQAYASPSAAANAHARMPRSAARNDWQYAYARGCANASSSIALAMFGEAGGGKQHVRHRRHAALQHDGGAQ